MSIPLSKMPVMAHLVLGYPTLAESLRTAEKYIRAGIEIIELQIPFSHPTADGPIITAACQEAVRQGLTVRDCIEAIRSIRAQHPAQEIMVMSYVNRIYAFGFQNFVDEMEGLGVKHLIVPDFPVAPSGPPMREGEVPARDSLSGTQAQGLTTFQKLSNLKFVPVLAANVSDERLEKLLHMGFDFFYLMSDFKITGSTFSLHQRLRELINRIKSYPLHGIHQPITNNQAPGTNRRIGIGFGISTPAQARLATQEADIAIIGSALIRAQQAGSLDSYLEELKIAFAATTEYA